MGIDTCCYTVLEDVGMVVPEARCTIQAKAGDDGMQSCVTHIPTSVNTKRGYACC